MYPLPFPLPSLSVCACGLTDWGGGEKRLLLAVYPRAELDGPAAEWLGSAMGVLHAKSGFERPAVYLNYASAEELGAIFGYEEWRMEKLKGLKRKWDPEGMFDAYHPIPRM